MTRPVIFAAADPELIQALDKAAARRRAAASLTGGVSKSMIVRIALVEWLERNHPDLVVQHVAQPALGAPR